MKYPDLKYLNTIRRRRAMRFFQNFRFTFAVKALCITCVFLIAGGIAIAKDFWETKTFDKWTPKECQKILTDSPWAKEFGLTGTIGSSSASAMDGQAPYIKYGIQLRSAAPVRQAIARQAQIERQYDSLTADQKQAFDQSMQAFLSDASSGFVIVHVSFDTNNRDYLRDLIRHWETQTTELLRNSVYLSGSKGEKVELFQYVPGSGASQEFQFIFPREVAGKEILKPDDKALQLEFAYPVIGRLGDGRAFIEFKTDKMKVNNEVVY
jgi:hypothetical protein